MKRQRAEELLRKIEKKDGQCALWLISAITEISDESPDITARDLSDIVQQTMPHTTMKYARQQKIG
ncbi:MAG: hypothetical protein RPU39_13625 [Candidatus Sedimenticola sp. (ex Thyasira tokunagai)]